MSFRHSAGGNPMASIQRAIKSVLAFAAGLFLLACPVQAASFQVKRGINLDIWVAWPDESRWSERDVLLPFPEWRQHLDASNLAALKAAGFDFVRMPVDPSPFLSAKTVDLRDDLFASVLESARMVNAAGLKVIVDLHALPAGGNRSIGTWQILEQQATFDAYVELVRRMARTLAMEDADRLALELMNEPTQGCAGAEGADWNDKLGRLFAAARSSATRLTLILSGACGGGADGLDALDASAYPDANLLWSFHSYAPFLLTHQGATWAGDFIPYVTGLPFPPYSVPRAELDAALDRIRDRIRAEAPWLRQSGLLSYLDEQVALVDTQEKLDAVMDEPFQRVNAWAKRNGVDPANIILGEFGMIRQEWEGDFTMPAAQRAAYVRDMAERAERAGYAWSVWGYGGAFGVVEEFEGRKAEPDVLDAIRSLP